MSIALKELLRQPQKFSAVGIALTLMVVLLTVLGGFLDGLELSQTGAYRAHDGKVLVFDEASDRQLARSRISTDTIDQLAALDQVEAVGRVAATFTVAGVGAGAQSGSSATDGSTGTPAELEDVALFGYDLATGPLPAPPAPGEAVVDAQLRRLAGVEVGDTLAVGATAEPLTVVAVIDDLTNGAPTVWVGADEWTRLVAAANPTSILPEATTQILVLEPAAGSDDGDVAAAVAASGIAGLDPVTATEAIEALDVVQQQSGTFTGIIYTTLVITLLVVALFFALLTLERVGLYAVLKALGARTGELLLGVSAQAIVISAVALVVGIALSFGFVSLLPPELPLRIEPTRVTQIAVGVLITAVLGSLFTARRLLRIDPAESIG